MSCELLAQAALPPAKIFRVPNGKKAEWTLGEIVFNFNFCFLTSSLPSCSPIARLCEGAVELRTPITLLTARTALLNGWTNVLVGKLTPDLQCSSTDASWELVSDNEK